MDHRTLDRWIAELMDCKPLTESEVESLCEKVRLLRASGPLASPCGRRLGSMPPLPATKSSLVHLRVPAPLSRRASACNDRGRF